MGVFQQHLLKIMTKQEALVEIEANLKTMQDSLKKAQALADEHGLTFKASFGGVSANDEGPVAGTYYGKGQDGDDNGYWYWENSSMNC